MCVCVCVCLLLYSQCPIGLIITHSFSSLFFPLKTNPISDSQISLDQFNVLKVIGRGSYAKVLMVCHLSTLGKCKSYIHGSYMYMYRY